jgi:hypothetical protein
MFDTKIVGGPRRYDVYAIERPSGDQVELMFRERCVVTRRWFSPS